MSKQLKLTQSAIISVFASTATIQVHADFLEDSKTSLNLRNFYFDRSFEQERQPSFGSWTQGANLIFESGYTDTPLQVGIDASIRYAVLLDSEHRKTSDLIVPYDSDKGELKSNYAKYGVTLKLKAANTELKVGELLPRTPIVHFDESRQLVTSLAGAMLENKDIQNLKITAGRITHINARNDDKYRKLSMMAAGPVKESDGLNLLGLDYQLTPDLSTSYWFGQLEDIYQQHYVGVNYKTQLNQTKVKLDLSYFYNKEDGDAYYGNIDSQALGGMTTFQHQNHLFTAGLQKNIGDSSFPLLTGYSPQHFLQAWSILTFNNPEETIWHFSYIYDFKDWNLPGVKVRFAYHHGDGIQRPGLADNKEIERVFSLLYNPTQGWLKGLGFEWRYTDANIKYGAGMQPGKSFVENRLITSYTFKF
ncbi:OprD family outer membrane porin [Acinetobacter nosocomialis]|uniref:OprD family outer membrane porin n=2 Tax=Acinetobacter TaxID=469 RepID=UPI00124FBE5B|nr:OprD family outer membrane porin [Acinetobacter nosocomialis]MDP7774431.1 OprD family outer membrane porin [Acinetobacter nosocomialis]